MDGNVKTVMIMGREHRITGQFYANFCCIGFLGVSFIMISKINILKKVQII